MAQLLYQGHGSFRLETTEGQVIYVDPYVGGGYDKAADLILITHGHDDHTAVDRVTCKETCRTITFKEAREAGEYRKFTLDGLQIEAVPAYNVNHDEEMCVGYVLSFDGLQVYASGDTSRTSAMEEKLREAHLDYALLPIDGIFNMGPEEASQCAAVIAARYTIPIHMKPGELFDRVMAEKFHSDGRIILEPGQVLELSPKK